MERPKTNQDAYKAVISNVEARGECFPMAALAKMLDLPRQSIRQWGGTVPESQALKVSILLDIPIEDIRPETVALAHKLRRKADEEAKARQARQGT
jgi:hypothetical protein